MAKELQIPAELGFVQSCVACDCYDWVTRGPRLAPGIVCIHESAGNFCSNNGVLAVYDRRGLAWVTSFQELRRRRISPEQAHEMLRNAGFAVGEVYVPHSNDGGAFIKGKFPEAYPCSVS